MTSSQSPRRQVRLDSAQLRCLAHPLRSRLLAALRLEGPATATMLAHRFGTNSGATSYHLRQLAAVGLVEEDEERGTARERWWRSVHESTSFVETDYLADPDDRAAAEWLVGQSLRVKTGWLQDWLASRHGWSTEWQEAADNSDVQLLLTASQLKRLNEELHAVLRRYREAGPDGDGDVQRVLVLLHTFPAPEARV